jgi:subtilisin family serine protease
MKKAGLFSSVFALFFASSVFAQIQKENYQGREVVAHEVLVDAKNISQQALNQLIQANDIEVAHHVGSAGAMLLHSRSLNVDSLMRALANHPDLAYIEPNNVIHAISTTPNDTYFSLMWGLSNTGQSILGTSGTPGDDIHALSAWDVSTGSKSIVVGVVDTGVDYNHIDLAPNIWSAPSSFTVTFGTTNITCPAGSHGFNAINRTCDPLDDNDHGSHVSGTIGAQGNNDTGVTGINWTANIMGLKFLDSSGSGSVSDAVDAIDFAIQVKNIFGANGANVRVLSNSWGGSGFSSSLLNEIQLANSNNMLFVVAAGNDGVNIDSNPQYPAVFSAPAYNAPNVVTVAATDSSDARASFSNYGSTSVQLGAPGVNIASTVRGDNYAYFSGTSMATPHVSGSAALILSVCSLNTSNLKSAILNNVDPVAGMAGITTTGGRLNLDRAIRSCAGTVNPDFALAPTPTIRTMGAGSTTTYIISVAPTGRFNGSVNFTMSGLPAGATGSFSPNPLSGPGSSTLTVNTSNTVVPGTYSLIVTGVSGSLTHTTNAKLIVSAPTVTLSSTSVSFANQAVNTTSGSKSVTLTNNGPGTLTIAGIADTGTNPGDFAETTTCPISPAALAANANCTISITFTPAAAGIRSAAVTITDNGSGSPQTVAVNGTGIATSPLVPWPNGYLYQATFTVAAGQVPSNQTNFSTLISGTYSDFATAGNGGLVTNTCAQTVGTTSLTVPCDLIFTSDAAGTSLLSWEFDSYNATTGAAAIWVKVPVLANGTVVYAWYGNSAVTTLQTTPAAVWSGSYLAAYHLKESTTGAAPQLMDSASGAHHGTLNGTLNSSQQQPGQVGGSLNFSSAQAWAALANPADFNFERSDSFSVAGWFKITPGTSGALISKIDTTSSNTGWGLQQFLNGGVSPTFAFGLHGNAIGNLAMAGTPTVSTGVWHYVVATYSGNSSVAGMKIYVDGVSQTLSTISDTLTASTLNAGTPALNGRNGPMAMSSDGIDELRVSAKGILLSADWVTASYNNQINPAAFFTANTGLTNRVTMSANTLNFGSQTTNTTSAGQTVTLTNNGPGALTISSIGITGTNASEFAETTTCPLTPSTLAANANCSISVTFTPTAGGARTAAVTITDNGSGSPRSVTLNGTGVVPPTVTVSPTTLNFGNQTTNTTSAAQTVTVTNNGPGALTISSIAIAGSNAGDFSETTTCPISPSMLAANANCSISVTFAPAATGMRSAVVTITDNGVASPQTVTLNGTGVVPVVGLSTTTLTFANQTVNTSSAAQSVTVTNNGPGALTISSIAITGTNAGDFAQTTTCPISPATLAVNASCSVNVTFMPAAAGARTASVTVTDNGNASPQSITLNGTGIPPLWSNGYTYQATFTVAAGQVPSNQTDFSTLISGTYLDFATTANGGRVANTCSQTIGTTTLTVPCDLIFTSDAAGSNLLSWEFDSYNAATGATDMGESARAGEWDRHLCLVRQLRGNDAADHTGGGLEQLSCGVPLERKHDRCRASTDGFQFRRTPRHAEWNPQQFPAATR